MTTIEELERELDQFHKNIAGSNKLIETITAVIEAIKLQKEDFSERSDALVKLIESVPVDIDKNNTATITELSQKIISAVEAQQTKIGERSDAVSKLVEALPGIIEEKNATAITDFYRQMVDVVSKEHKLYINNIDQYVQALEGMKNGLAAQQNAFVEKLDDATSSFSQECATHREALAAVKTELAQETTGTMNAITAENAKICENYLQQVRAICDETKEGFAAYTSKLQTLTSQFAETEKNTREVIANAERSLEAIVSDAAKSYQETSNAIEKSTEKLLLEIKVYIEHLERQNESLVKNIEEKFNNSFKAVQNENAQLLDKLNQIQASQKKGMILSGIGMAVIAVLCIISFFI